jgi:predicted nucleic acid-binding protein
MPSQAFFDSNVLIYAYTQDKVKTPRAQELLSFGGVVNTQSLNETANTLWRKFKTPWPRIAQIIEAILEDCPDPLPLTLETHRTALRICERYGYSFYDGLILAAALEARCAILYTEDLQHSQTIEGLRIVNPFHEAGN